MYKFKDELKVFDNTGAHIVKLMYNVKTELQVVNFYLVNHFAGFTKFEITHFVATTNRYERLADGAYTTDSNRRKTHEMKSAGIRGASIYTVKASDNTIIELEFTFPLLRMMSNLHTIIIPALGNKFVSQLHLAKNSETGEWAPVTIVEPVIKLVDTNDKTILNKKVDNENKETAPVESVKLNGVDPAILESGSEEAAKKLFEQITKLNNPEETTQENEDSKTDNESEDTVKSDGSDEATASVTVTGDNTKADSSDNNENNSKPSDEN